MKEGFGSISEYWHPKIAAELNDSYLKLAKLKGEFVWHKHENEDELFLVVEGSLRIRLQDSDLVLKAGELVVIPRGIEHCPIAKEEVKVVLIESKTTINTGEASSDRKVESEWIGETVSDSKEEA